MEWQHALEIVIYGAVAIGAVAFIAPPVVELTRGILTGSGTEASQDNVRTFALAGAASNVVGPSRT